MFLYRIHDPCPLGLTGILTVATWTRCWGQVRGSWHPGADRVLGLKAEGPQWLPTHHDPRFVKLQYHIPQTYLDMMSLLLWPLNYGPFGAHAHDLNVAHMSLQRPVAQTARKASCFGSLGIKVSHGALLKVV